MKLTPDMFDFEKYDYFNYQGYQSTPDPETENLDNDGWCKGGYGYGIFRKLKEPTYYRLLNEGERIQNGDEYLTGFPPKDWKHVEGLREDCFMSGHLVPHRRKLPPGAKV